MKKVFVLLLSVMLCLTMLTITGCSGGSDEGGEPAQAEASEETAQEEESATEEDTAESEASAGSSQSSGTIDTEPRERTKEEIEQVVAAIVDKKCKDGGLQDLKISDNGEEVYVSVIYEGGEGTASFAVSLFGDTIANYTMEMCTNVKKISYHGEATNLDGYRDIYYEKGDDGKVYYGKEEGGSFKSEE